MVRKRGVSRIAAGAALALLAAISPRAAAAVDVVVSHAAGAPGRGPAASISMNSYGMAVHGDRVYFGDAMGAVVRVIDTTTGMADVVAGFGHPGFSGDGGAATLAALDWPTGVAVDASGRVCIADVETFRIRCVAEDGTISTLAGIGVEGSTGDGGLATLAAVDADGIAFDAAGNLYLAEPDSHRVRRIRPDGVIEAFAGTGTEGLSGDGGPALTAMFSHPYDVAVDAAGNVVIADTSNARIRKVDRDGIVTTIAGAGTRSITSADGFPASELSNAGSYGITTHADGSIYFTSTRTVFRIAPDGTLQRVAGTFQAGDSGDGGPARSARVNPARGIALDAAGRLYIGDYETSRVRVVDTDGIIRPLGGNNRTYYSGDGGPATAAQLAHPRKVVSDRADGFYVTEGGHVRHVDGAGTITTHATIPDGSVDVLPNGDLVFPDADDHQVKVLRADGSIVAIAGVRGQGRFSGDGGPATAAMMNRPSDVAVGSDGSVYIADRQNSRIRRVDPSGIMHTVAGGPFATSLDADGIPATQARLTFTDSVAVSPSGEVYFNEPSKFRVRRVDAAGVIHTAAGTGVEGFTGDGGPGNQARIEWPSGLFVDAGGNLILATGYRIRLVDRRGLIWTLAGDGGCCTNSLPQPASAAQINPGDVAVDSLGRILFTETSGRRVRRLDLVDLCPDAPGIDPIDADQDGIGDGCECATGAPCEDDGNPCTRDVCDASGDCTHPAGNAGTVCRAVDGPCDVAESCDGTSSGCPGDGYATSAVTCRAAAGACDQADQCSGSSPACPADAKAAAGTTCTPDAEACTRDVCDGAGTCTHPGGNSGSVCRPAAGSCDVSERCDGTTPSCPQDRLLVAGTLCRNAAGDCDLAEQCSGASASCPIDRPAPAGTSCTSDGLDCTTDVCNGASFACLHVPLRAGTVCRAASGACDLAETCDGIGGACPEDTGLPDGDDDGECDAQDPCTNVGGAQDFTTPPASSLLLSNLADSGTPSDDKLKVTAFFSLPPGTGFADVRPELRGARIVLETSTGSRLLDVVLPAGLYGSATRRGWRRAGKSWTFTDRSTSPTSGIDKVTITDRERPATPGAVKAVITGKRGAYPVAPAELPAQVVITLGDAHDAATGTCGESTFGAGQCAFTGSGSKLRCVE